MRSESEVDATVSVSAAAAENVCQNGISVKLSWILDD
jgi:hypothetical protein